VKGKSILELSPLLKEADISAHRIGYFASHPSHRIISDIRNRCFKIPNNTSSRSRGVREEVFVCSTHETHVTLSRVLRVQMCVKVEIDAQTRDIAKTNATHKCNSQTHHVL